MSSEEHQIKRNKEIAAEDLNNPGQAPGTEDEPGAEADTGAETETVEESIEQQLDQAQATIKEYWEQILRLKAEIENNRKRSVRDIENAHKYALRNFSESLLPIVDSMEMAQKARRPKMQVWKVLLKARS